MLSLEKGAQSPQLFYRQGSGSPADSFTPALYQYHSNEKVSQSVVQAFWLGASAIGYGGGFGFFGFGVLLFFFNSRP